MIVRIYSSRFFLKFTWLLPFLLLISGCAHPPSETDIEQVLENHYGYFLELESIERINGYEDPDGYYIVEVHGFFRFTEDYQAVMEDANALEGLLLGMLSVLFGEFKKGESYEERFEITFVDTENGWRAVNVY